jgi:purine-binding chemotaxis protein CheW
MSQAQSTTQVLEFQLGEETYCVDIEYIAEIVDGDDVTQVPDSERHVEGIMDLRGRTTTIINPKSLFGIHDDGGKSRVIVFDLDMTDDGEAIGWIVDEVEQVVHVSDDEVDQPSGRTDERVRGVIRRDDGFVIWVEPDGV